jgi:integrase
MIVRGHPLSSAAEWRFFGGSMRLSVKKRFAEMLPAKKLGGLPPGWHADGRGLYLLVTPTGARRWVLRTVVKGGRRREFGLGSLHDVSIEEARAKASEMRRAAKSGRDPLAERHARTVHAMTFRQAFDSFFMLKSRSLSNAKHLAQWRTTMEVYVFPQIGNRPVGEIASGEILALLDPIWYAKPETARRVLQRMRAVFDAAILRNWRERASPCIGVVQALGGTGHRAVQHHRALPYRDVPAFVKMLRACKARPETRLAFEWLILTATRSGETRCAAWSEIDEQRALWIIPRQRMKGSGANRRDHQVPLPARCKDILAEARALNHDRRLVFASSLTGKSLSDMTFTKLLRDTGFASKATAHGFRSSFRDWATEVDKVREVVAEAALAHSVKDKTEAAYRRATYLQERCALMERWAGYVQSECDGVAAASVLLYPAA